jgi:hypothetical protein
MSVASHLLYECGESFVHGSSENAQNRGLIVHNYFKKA